MLEASVYRVLENGLRRRGIKDWDCLLMRYADVREVLKFIPRNCQGPEIASSFVADNSSNGVENSWIRNGDAPRSGFRKKNSREKVMNRSGATTYTQNSKTQRILVTLFRWCPIFSFFSNIFSFLFIFSNFFFWCPWQAHGAPGRPVVPLTGAPARPMVLLADL